MTYSLPILLAVWTSAVAGLPDDLKQYYLAPNAAKRSSIANRILKDPAVTESALTKAIAAVQLWDTQSPGIQEFDFPLGRNKEVIKHAVVSIPTGYDPARAWPLVITLHGQGQSAQSMMAMTRAMLGAATDEHVIVAPQDIGPLGFTEPTTVVDQPRQLLISLRKRFHVDSDRVFLMGYSIGGHNTWMAGVMHADLFAGIMPLATPLQVIGNDALYDVLTPNLRNLDTLFVWGAKDNLGQDGRPHPMGGNAEMSRNLAMAMREACGDRFVGIELPDAGHGDVRPPKEAVTRFLSKKRDAWPRKVHQRFRLAEQSDAGWIRAAALVGKELADAPSTVKLKPGEDPQVAQKRHLVAQLGLIEATVDGQTISITIKKAKGVVVLLSGELIDLKQPVTVLRNKHKVFSGKITRDRNVMLRETAETWDFARIPQARMVIPASGDKVTFGYSDRAK